MSATQKKMKILVSVDSDDLGDLNEICKDYRNLNPNQLLAMAAGELAKLKSKKGELFHALARISDVDTDAASEPQKRKRSTSHSRDANPVLSAAH